MKHVILSCNTFTSVFKFLCVSFTSIKKIVVTEKIYLLNLIALNNIWYSKSKNNKIQKDRNVYKWNHGWKTGTAKVHVITYFESFR